MNSKKVILIFLGTLSLCLGVVGIIIPVLPTTPFLLLSAGLFFHSSTRLYRYLITNKYVGVYILKFRSDNGMTRKLKLYSIFIMWLMICVSCLFFIQSLSVRIFIVVLGIIGSLVMGIVVPTVYNSTNNNK